jgi:hypothetical protein
MKVLLAGVLLFAAAAAPVRAKDTALVDILAGLDRMHGLRMMSEDKTYELPARGEKMSGRSDDFLRRRTPQEIMDSGLSTGCGDYAFSFYTLMKARGRDVLYADAAALTAHSLKNHFDGHTAVAVKDEASGNWILVDPTFGRIISGDWDPKERLYVGPAGRFWFGYVGKLEDYPVKGPEELKKFYAETLATVPKDVWAKIFIKYEFTIDDSMKLKGGGYTNPHVVEFIRRPDEFYEGMGVTPEKSVRVTLKDGVDDKADTCEKNDDATWTCWISRGAAMSQHMTDWMTDRIASGSPR